MKKTTADRIMEKILGEELPTHKPAIKIFFRCFDCKGVLRKPIMYCRDCLQKADNMEKYKNYFNL